MRPEEGQILGKANNEQMRTNPIDDGPNHPPRIFVFIFWRADECWLRGAND
jgi:hypothetical protein